ncbi:hypothetical protein RSAG8_02251, partial [Rhizoctonia solani AG-8 WAC10335]
MKVYGISSIQDLQHCKFGEGLLTHDAINFMLQGDLYKHLKSLEEAAATKDINDHDKAEALLNPSHSSNLGNPIKSSSKHVPDDNHPADI